MNWLPILSSIEFPVPISRKIKGKIWEDCVHIESLLKTNDSQYAVSLASTPLYSYQSLPQCTSISYPPPFSSFSRRVAYQALSSPEHPDCTASWRCSVGSENYQFLVAWRLRLFDRAFGIVVNIAQFVLCDHSSPLCSVVRIN